MQTKLIIAAVFLVLLLGCAGSLSLYVHARSALSEANGTIKVLESTVDAYIEAQVQVQDSIQKSSAVRQEIDHALSANQDWAGAPVPDAVIAGLCKQGNCQTGKVPAPGN